MNKCTTISDDYCWEFGGCYLDKYGKRHYYPLLLNPTVDEMLRVLSLTKNQTASLGLEKCPNPKLGPFRVTVDIENEKFFVMLQEYTDNNDVNVRTALNPNGRDEMVEVVGDNWSAKEVLDDFDVVKTIFIEFLTTGDVSTDLLTIGASYPNGNMATAHAEIGVIQQAFNAEKTAGQDMAMTVTGRDVCGYCKGDIAAAAEKAGLKSLTINTTTEEGKFIIYQWKPGMTLLKRKL